MYSPRDSSKLVVDVCIVAVVFTRREKRSTFASLPASRSSAAAAAAGILETFYTLYQNIKVVRSDREVFPNVRAPPRLCQNYAQALFRCWESFR